jgi:hypothetical protein
MPKTRGPLKKTRMAQAPLPGPRGIIAGFAQRRALRHHDEKMENGFDTKA